MKKYLLLLLFIYVAQAKAQCPITVSASATICAGGSTTFTASGATTYTWAPVATLSAVNIANPVASPTATTIYTVAATTGTCTATNTVMVTVIPVPTASLSSLQVCYPSCSMLSSTVSPTSAGDTFTWDYGDGLSIMAGPANPSHCYTTPGTYIASYTVTDANSCIATATTNITVNQSPTVSIGAPTSVCSPACVTYSSNVSSSIIIQTFAWTLDNGLFSPMANPGQVCYPTGFTNIHVELVVTDINGCTDTARTNIAVTPTPTMTVITPPPYCSGDLISSPTINTNPITGVTFTYITANATIGMPTTGTGIPMPYTAPANATLVDISSPVTYTPTLNGCDGPAVTETITIKPTPYMQSIVNQYVCSGAYSNPVQLTTIPSMATVTWAILYQAPTPTTGNSNPFPGFQLSNPDSVNIATTVTVTPTLNGCVGPDSSFSIIVYPQPTISYTLIQDTAPHVWDVYPSFSGGNAPYAYIWNWGDGTTSNMAYTSHTYSVAGTYSICLTVSDANGCTTTYCQNDSVFRLSSSNTMITVNVINGTAPTGIKTINSTDLLTIYPNPANNKITIDATDIADVKLFDVVGKQITTTKENQIDVSNLNDGVYFIQVQTNTTTTTHKIIVQH